MTDIWKRWEKHYLRLGIEPNVEIFVWTVNRTGIHNDKKVEYFTWDRFANEIIAACEDLV